jgi:hypothetical protein
VIVFLQVQVQQIQDSEIRHAQLLSIYCFTIQLLIGFRKGENVGIVFVEAMIRYK